MRNPIKLSMAYQDDSMLRRIFSWLTRIGAGPKFGSRPIGWYQSHQCHAIDSLRVLGADMVRVEAGIIQTQKEGKWVDLMTARELYDKADTKCRTNG